MIDPYADWDAAYVLGALSSAERREYEAHVDDCARCAAAVAELGMMPALLRLVPDAHGAEQLTAAAPPMRPVASIPRRSPPAKVLAAAAALLAACVTAGIVLGARSPEGPDVHTVALAAVRQSPLQATVALTPESWGTQVSMTCTYAGEYGARTRYALFVVDASGRRQLVSRWQAGPGEVARTTGATDLAPADIARVELRAADGRLLLARSL